MENRDDSDAGNAICADRDRGNGAHLIRCLCVALVLILAALSLPSAAFALDGDEASDHQAIPSTREVIEAGVQDAIALINGEKAPEDVLTHQFLSMVPPSQFNAITAQMTSLYGQVLGVESIDITGTYRARIALRFEKAIGYGNITIRGEPPQKIAGLLLREFKTPDDSLSKIESDLTTLPGDVSVYFGTLDGSEERLNLDADRQMAIGSTFKLYVLAAVAQKVKLGEASWDDVIPLNRHSLFPTGGMQDWPKNAPVTLHTLATMMIAKSDNTATDLLHHYVGEKAVIAEVMASGHSQPAFNLPFLTTRQMFALKAAGEEKMESYRAATLREQRAMLAELEQGELDEAAISATFSGDPVAIDLEWFASGRDIARAFDHLLRQDDQQALNILRINPSLPDSLRDRWWQVGYKGGSEPGVLNLSWMLMDKGGRWHVLSMSWNNPDAPVDHPTFELLAQRILSLPD